MMMFHRTMLTVLVCLLWLVSSEPTFANGYTGVQTGEPATEQPTEPTRGSVIANRSDTAIAAQIHQIYEQLDETQSVVVNVDAGVATLSGLVRDNEAVKRAEALAQSVAGVVAVENNLQADVSVTTRLRPIVAQTENLAQNSWRMGPLIVVALLVFAIINWLGARLAGWTALWKRFAPNSFIAELLQTTVRVCAFGIAVLAVLTILDATAFLNAFLGAAGVIGLAIGFAVRDTIENYISSIMLSIRQPFQPNDHVVIDGEEGRVIRLTSRATILLTPDGNHLRIPNAIVFKAKILNYSRNANRRFSFVLGIDGQDDPLGALHLGKQALAGLDFVLNDPVPSAVIKDMGDSNILLGFYGWVDQGKSSLGKSRSAAISAVKNALEGEGFSFPEPMYRIRIDSAESDLEAIVSTQKKRDNPRDASKQASPAASMTIDTVPEREIENMVNVERLSEAENDLLSDAAKQE